MSGTECSFRFLLNVPAGNHLYQDTDMVESECYLKPSLECSIQSCPSGGGGKVGQLLVAANAGLCRLRSDAKVPAAKGILTALPLRQGSAVTQTTNFRDRSCPAPGIALGAFRHE
jgi:hypothetical protein